MSCYNCILKGMTRCEQKRASPFLVGGGGVCVVLVVVEKADVCAHANAGCLVTDKSREKADAYNGQAKNQNFVEKRAPPHHRGVEKALTL